MKNKKEKMKEVYAVVFDSYKLSDLVSENGTAAEIYRCFETLDKAKVFAIDYMNDRSNEPAGNAMIIKCSLVGIVKPQFVFIDDESLEVL